MTETALDELTAVQQTVITEQIQSAVKWRRFAYRFWVFRSVYLIPWAFWVRFIVPWVSPAKAVARQLGFLRHYLMLVFRYRGVSSYQVTPFDVTFTRPTVILSNRSDYMKGLFCFTQFETPVIVPLLRQYFQLGVLPFWRFPSMKWLLNKISYPDGPLNCNQENVATLLSAGYPVVVFVNESTEKADLDSALHINRSAAELFKRPDIDVYVMVEDGFDYFEFASMGHPTQVRCSLVKREEMFESFLTSPPSDEAVLESLGRLFGFRGIVVLDPR